MNHQHNIIFEEEYILSSGFDFHPALADWFLKTLHCNENEIVRVMEIGCNDYSCPVHETWFEFLSSGKKIRISRERSKISKLDFSLSLKKQFQ